MLNRPNRLYKEYRAAGGLHSFKDWINQVKSEDYLNLTGPSKDSISTTLEELHKTAGYKPSLSKDYWLGIPKNAWIVSGIVITGVVTYLIIKNKS